MTKKKIVIDTDVWCTQVQKAKRDGIKLGTLSQWVKRSRDGTTNNPIDILEIPELSIILVKK